MNPPIKPELSDFDLTEESLKAVEELESLQRSLDSSQTGYIDFKDSPLLYIFSGFVMWLFPCGCIAAIILRSFDATQKEMIYTGLISAALCGFGHYMYSVWGAKSKFESAQRTFDLYRKDKCPAATSQKFSRWVTANEQFESQLKEYNAYAEKEARKKNDYWRSMDGHRFEREFTSLLKRNGLSVKTTKGSGDEGIDIIGTYHGDPLIIQCKAWADPAPPGAIRDFLGSWELHNQRKGLAWFVCLGGFTSGAVDAAEKGGIRLLSIDDVLEMEKSGQ